MDQKEATRPVINLDDLSYFDDDLKLEAVLLSNKDRELLTLTPMDKELEDSDEDEVTVSKKTPSQQPKSMMSSKIYTKTEKDDQQSASKAKQQQNLPDRLGLEINMKKKESPKKVNEDLIDFNDEDKEFGDF